jgi:hypothetical protein
MNTTTITELTRENGWAPLREHLGARAFGTLTKNADSASSTSMPKRSEHESYASSSQAAHGSLSRGSATRR